MQHRCITLSDIKAQEEILALLHLTFAYMEGRIDPPSSLHQLSVSDIAAHADKHQVWVVGDPIIACMFLTLKTQTLYLGKLAIHPDHRGQGIARKLISIAEDQTRLLGLDIIELQTRIEITENQETFMRLGFQKTEEGRHPGFDRTTEVTMQRRVSRVG